MTKTTPQEAKREYYRKWRETHKEQIKAANERYWARKAAEMDAAKTAKEAKAEEEIQEAKKAYYRTYRKEHRNELNAYYRNYRREHPEAIAATQLRFWAKKAAEINMAEEAGRENA